MTSEAPGVLERYVSATNSLNLAMHRLTDGHDGRCDADVLLAKGYAAAHDEKGRQALMLFRMVVNDDFNHLPVAVHYAYRWVRSAQIGKRKDNLPRTSREDTQEVVNVTMRWWLRSVCRECLGRRMALVYPGAPVTSARACKVCKGAGKTSLNELAGPAKIIAANWLAAELDRLIDKIENEMRAALARREQAS